MRLPERGSVTNGGCHTGFSEELCAFFCGEIFPQNFLSLDIRLYGTNFVMLLLPGAAQYVSPYAFGVFSAHTFSGPNFFWKSFKNMMLK